MHDAAQLREQAVLVVDSSLGMSIGKTAAQCAHAAVGVFKSMHINAVPWLHTWEVSSLLGACTSPHTCEACTAL